MTLAQLYGWPHEMLHVLALAADRPRAQAVAHTHVDIPADLGRGEFVFVAGLPALVFWPLTGIAAQQLLAAQGLGAALFWLVCAALPCPSLPAAAGTLGDLMLIAAAAAAQGLSRNCFRRRSPASG